MHKNIIKPLFTKIADENTSIVFDDSYYFNQISMQKFELKPILIQDNGMDSSGFQSREFEQFKLFNKDINIG